ncbi:MAG: glycosyltransferase family 4 protein [Gammaproteobacteria bacterium]
MNDHTRTVLLVQRILPHYRTGFFRLLREKLHSQSVELRLVAGQEREGTVPVSVPLHEDWVTWIENHYLALGGAELCWQPVVRMSAGFDLVILEQANRLLANHVIQAQRRLRGHPVAFWGHGANFQQRERFSVNEMVKRRLLRRVDWWFAYTSLSAEKLAERGFPCERITVVENSIDSGEFRSAMAAVTATDIAAARESIRLSPGPVGLFCGGMYREKKLDFLVEACVEIRQAVPDFQMLWIGHGPEQHLVEAACRAHAWMRYLGPITGPERAVYFALSEVILMPGAVGLVIVDSFNAARPVFTAKHDLHGPEIAYLEHGRNGFMSRLDVGDYAEDVVTFLRNSAMQEVVQAGCRRSAGTYSLENMAERFADGILNCLSRP